MGVLLFAVLTVQLYHIARTSALSLSLTITLAEAGTIAVASHLATSSVDAHKVHNDMRRRIPIPVLPCSPRQRAII